MFKSYITNSIALSIGLVAGVIMGYKYCEAKTRAKVDDEIQQVRDLYLKKVSEINEETKEYVSAIIKDVPLNDNDEFLDKSTISYDISKKDDVVPYHNFYPKNEKEDEEVLFENEMSNINFVDQQDFDDFNGYTKFNYIVYTDGVITDVTDGLDEETIIEDPEILLGSDNIAELMKSNKELHWIRNDIQCADFEIVKEVEAYEAVVGKSPHMPD